MGYFGSLKDRVKLFLTETLFIKNDSKHDRAYYDEESRAGGRLWLFLLFLSSAVIISKYLSDIDFHHLFKIGLELNYVIINGTRETLSNILNNIWIIVCGIRWLLLPTLFATGFVSFSWIVLYKDSDIPGVNPPTPFSPPRYRYQSQRSMDFSYALTGTFGILIFIRLLYQSYREVQTEY